MIQLNITFFIGVQERFNDTIVQGKYWEKCSTHDKHLSNAYYLAYIDNDDSISSVRIFYTNLGLLEVK